MKILTCTAVLLFFTGTVWGDDEDRTYAHRKRLKDSLFTNYDKTILPGGKGGIQLKFGVALIQVAGVDRDNGIFTLSLWERMLWRDEQLKWEPDEELGPSHLKLPSDMFWLPDIRSYNSLTAAEAGRKRNTFWQTF